jgi:hypothetical protein
VESQADRPVAAGEVIAAAFQLPLVHWKATLSYVAVTVFPQLVWGLLKRPLDLTKEFEPIEEYAKSPDPDIQHVLELLRPLWRYLAISAAAESVAWVFWLLATGALTLALAEGIRERPISQRATYRSALRLLPAMLGANLIVIFAACIGLLLCIVPGFVCMFAGSFVDPAVVVGHRGPISACAASARQAFQVPGQTVLLLLVGGAFAFALTMTVSAADHFISMPAVSDVISQIVTPLGSLPTISGVAYLFVRRQGSGTVAAKS